MLPPTATVTPPPASHDAEIQRNLRYSTADATAYSLMVGSGEQYLAAFALAIGMSQTLAGLLSAVPLLVGSLLQLVSPYGVRKLGSYKRWVITCALSQALAFVPLILAAWHGSIPSWALFAVAAFYWAASLGTGPAWNTWITQLVPEALRPRYFATRNRWAQMGLLTGLTGAGLWLHWARSHGHLLTAFGSIFTLACGARGLSALFLSRQAEMAIPEATDRQLTLVEWLHRLRRSRDGRTLIYLLVTQTSVYIAAPYFTPYMLANRHFSYLTYMGLLAVALVAKIVSLPSLGAFARKYGTHRLLWLGGIGIAPMSLLWVFSDNVLYLCAAQTISGITWAAYELATVLVFFETIQPEERVSVLTYFNLANSTALIAGSLLGGVLLTAMGEQQTGYFIVFSVSFFFRALSLLAMPRTVRISPAAIAVAVRSLSLRATIGAVARPILGSLPRHHDR